MNSITKGLMFIVALIFCMVLFSGVAFAARPLTTDDAWTVEKGTFQVETGFDFTRQDNHDKEFSPSVTLTYGLFERMDIGVGSAYLFVNPAEGEKENGFADTELKIKYRLLDDKDWVPAFAISGILKIPTASDTKGLGSGKTDFGINTIFTKNLSKRVGSSSQPGIYLYRRTWGTQRIQLFSCRAVRFIGQMVTGRRNKWSE